LAVSNAAPEEARGLAPAQAGANFVCDGVATQTCHFAVLRDTGARTDFALASGATHHLSEVATGVDHYMVTINFAPRKSVVVFAHAGARQTQRLVQTRDRVRPGH